MGDFTMPSLGADMEAGTVAKWLVKPGDEVHRGDIVAVVETEKSTIEVEIFQNGVISDLLVHEGERVPVGSVLAHVDIGEPHPSPPPAGVLDTAWPASPSHRPAIVRSPVIRHLAEEIGVDVTAIEGSGPGGLATRRDVERARRPPRSSPLARRLAAERGIDLAGVSGTGPGGSVRERDVCQAASSPERRDIAPPTTAVPIAAGPTAAGPTTAEARQAAMRRAIGDLMARSKREIPHYYLATTIDIGPALDWLAATNLERPTAHRLVLPALLLKATACAVARVPEVNGFVVGGAFSPSEAVHVGVAVSLRTGGVVAPAIHDAAQLSLADLMTRLRDVVGRARTGVLRSSEMSDATITVTNLGDLGVESVFGVIYPPQVALVGFGRVTERPYARDGMVGVRPTVTATLSADHRASDGHRGGLFLAEIDRLLQEPGKL